jgi:protein SCO1/2
MQIVAQHVRKSSSVLLIFCSLCFCLFYFAVDARVAKAHDAVPHGTAVTDLVGFDQRLNEQVPPELTFVDDAGQRVDLAQYFGEKPVILALSYFECETLCPLVRQGLVESLRPLTFVAGNEFDVVLVSIDPDETAATASAVKQETVASYARASNDRASSEDGWHFLTGDHATIDSLADAIGFHYAYDGEQDEYAHASGVVILTPQGRIARYFFGIEYAPNDLRLGLVEASQNRIGSLVDQLMLLCYHYDPTTGKYSLLIMNVLRGAGVLTVTLLGATIFLLSRKDSNKESNKRVALLG